MSFTMQLDFKVKNGVERNRQLVFFFSYLCAEAGKKFYGLSAWSFGKRVYHLFRYCISISLFGFWFKYMHFWGENYGVVMSAEFCCLFSSFLSLEKKGIIWNFHFHLSSAHLTLCKDSTFLVLLFQEHEWFHIFCHYFT